MNSGCGRHRSIHGLELGEYKKQRGYSSNGTNHDSQWYHIALVLPIDYPAGRATTAKEGMGIDFLAVAARSRDGS